MIKKSFLFLPLFLASFCVHAQDSVRFYKTIDTLCSSYFYGRGYINEGHLKTAKYLKKKFSKADTSFFQEFGFKLNKLSKEELILAGDTLIGGVDFIPIPQSKGVPNKTFATFFMDSSFFRSKKKIKKFLKKDIRNTALVFNSTWESKITDTPELRSKLYLEAGCIIKLIDGELLSSFSHEAWMPPSFALKSSKWLNQETVKVNLRQKEEEVRSNNVIAVINGRDRGLKELIITAHYDHVGGYETVYVPGANDNASGVAMMLELYAYFLKNSPERTVRFIAFGVEEVGLLGSKYYVELMEKSRVEFVLNLDLLGAGSGGITIVNGKVFTDYSHRLSSINTNKKYISKIKLRGEAANSDHYYFSKNGVPAFFIYSNGSVGGYHNFKDRVGDLERGYFSSLFLLLKDFCTSI